MAVRVWVLMGVRCMNNGVNWRRVICIMVMIMGLG